MTLAAPRPAQIACLALTLTALNACGEEAQVDARSQCKAGEVAAFTQGSVRGEGYRRELDINARGVTGTITSQEIRVVLGQVTSPDGKPQKLILRLYANGSRSLVSTIADFTVAGPATLQLKDASAIGAGSQSRTDLTQYGCAFANGQICAQIGFDANADEILTDQDAFAYNAALGEVTLVGINDRRSGVERVALNWTLTTGTNLLGFQDTSSASFEGCLNARYLAQGEIFTIK